MFIIDDTANTNNDLETTTPITFYVPFLVQSSQTNKQLLIPDTATF